jgi:hypothetical protein
MPGFGPASAPVAICGVLAFLEASNSYKFDYIGVDHAAPWQAGAVRSQRSIESAHVCSAEQLRDVPAAPTVWDVTLF